MLIYAYTLRGRKKLMKIIAELHTHTSDYCDHAGSTIDEFIAEAKRQGLKYYAATNHSAIIDTRTPHTFYLDNLKRSYEGITFLAGTEADIRDLHGGFDMCQFDLLSLDFVIASVHVNILPHDLPDYTNAYVKAAENPAVDCLGHIARDPRYPFDTETVLNAVKANGKLVEFNDGTLKDDNGIRKEACGAIMDACARLGVESIVTTDAHHIGRLGANGETLKMLEDRNHPEHLIINADEDRMAKFLARRKEERKKALQALFRI